MDPLAQGTHTFLIENRGGGPLTLTLGQPSSASVQGQIAPSTVAPGQSAEVRVTWTTGGARPEYLGGVTVETNDRSKDQIRFTVRGRVRVQIGAAPERLAVADVPPGGTAEVSTVVYSQVWRDLQLAKASCSIPGAVCRVAPAGDDALSRLQAAAGRSLTVTVPGEMPSGPFTGVVRIEAQNAVRRVPAFGGSGIADFRPGPAPLGRLWRRAPGQRSCRPGGSSAGPPVAAPSALESPRPGGRPPLDARANPTRFCPSLPRTVRHGVWRPTIPPRSLDSGGRTGMHLPRRAVG